MSQAIEEIMLRVAGVPGVKPCTGHPTVSCVPDPFPQISLAMGSKNSTHPVSNGSILSWSWDDIRAFEEHSHVYFLPTADNTALRISIGAGKVMVEVNEKGDQGSSGIGGNRYWKQLHTPGLISPSLPRSDPRRLFRFTSAKKAGIGLRRPVGDQATQGKLHK